MGYHRTGDRLRDIRGDRSGHPRCHCAVAGRGGCVHAARLLEIALLWAAHHVANVCGHRSVFVVYVYLRDPRRQEPPGRADFDSSARRSAIRSYSWIFIFHGDVFSWLVSGLDTWGRMRRDFCDLYQPSLEHGVLVLPIIANGAERFGGGRDGLWPFALATLLAARSAVCDARLGLQHDDVHVWRLVFRRCIRSHFGGRHDDKAAGNWILARGCD